MDGCTDFYDKIETQYTRRVPNYWYRQNGVQWRLYFQGYNADPGQFTIESSETDPLTGDNITFTNTTVTPYGSNLFYRPIPFEFLKTFETNPQLIVTVNDLPAVCHNLNCNYTYVTPVGEVTTFTYAPATKVLTLTGTNLPSNSSFIQSISFAKTICKLDNTMTFKADQTEIACTLEREPTCGSHLPEIVTK
jgi:hypothetical protein